MPIGPKILLRLVKEKKLVENLSQRELTNPEGAGFDLRLGEVYRIRGKGFLGIDERKTPDTRLLAVYGEGKHESFSFEYNEYFLVRTVESVNIPEDIIAYVLMRSTLHRSGLLLLSNQVSPGYRGRLTFGIINLGSLEVKIELGARICHILFEKVEGGGISYKGQWQGGRVTTTKKEKQV